jgi:hypothetical protein
MAIGAEGDAATNVLGGLEAEELLAVVRIPHLPSAGQVLGEQSFESRNHFLRAAAEGMRRILVDHARSGNADKRGGQRQRIMAIQPERSANYASPSAGRIAGNDVSFRIGILARGRQRRTA